MSLSFRQHASVFPFVVAQPGFTQTLARIRRLGKCLNFAKWSSHLNIDTLPYPQANKIPELIPRTRVIEAAKKIEKTSVQFL